MLTDKPLNLFTYVKCALQVVFFSSNLVASEGCVWGKWAKGRNFCRRIGAVTSLLEIHLKNEGMPTDQPPFGCLHLSWQLVVSEVFSTHRSQAARGFVTKLCSVHGPFIGPCAKLVLYGRFLTSLWWTGAAVDEPKAAPFPWEALVTLPRKANCLFSGSHFPRGCGRSLGIWHHQYLSFKGRLGDRNLAYNCV